MGGKVLIFIYGCYSGTHASVVAAALHLEWISPGRLPSWQELTKLPYFDACAPTGLLFIGVDKRGCRVYTAAVGSEGKLVSRAIPSLLNILGREPSEVTFIDLASRAPRSLVWGGFLRRCPGGRGTGLWLISRGLKAYYPAIAGKIPAQT